MNNLVVRSREELAAAIDAIASGIQQGLRDARDRGVLVHMPEQVTIQGVYLIEANVAAEESSQTTPEIERTSAESTPQTVVTRNSTEGGTTVQDTSNIPGQNRLEEKLGGDKSTTVTDYEEF